MKNVGWAVPPTWVETCDVNAVIQYRGIQRATEGGRWPTYCTAPCRQTVDHKASGNKYFCQVSFASSFLERCIVINAKNALRTVIISKLVSIQEVWMIEQACCVGSKPRVF